MDTWDSRSTAAARAVTHLYGQRLWALPGTYLGAIVRPWRLSPEWHYWWQAHFVDCLVDAGYRELATGVRFDGDDRPSAGKLASRLVTTMRLRNALRFTNSYYDDMAWLALSVGRLDALAEAAKKVGRRSGRLRNARAMARLQDTLTSAVTPDLGGGVFWNTARDFKNTPATAPVALIAARRGDVAVASELLAWLDAKVYDAESGLYLDGVKIRDGAEVLEPSVWTYNQGPVLGALLELAKVAGGSGGSGGTGDTGGSAYVARAASLVRAVDRELVVMAPDGRRSLKTHGSGDGGLFTGILVRYLALAARSAELRAADAEACEIARRLVLDTASALWGGAQEARLKVSLFIAREGLIFPNEPFKSSAECYPGAARIDLSTQLQAWMCFEAAATL